MSLLVSRATLPHRLQLRPMPLSAPAAQHDRFVQRFGATGVIAHGGGPAQGGDGRRRPHRGEVAFVDELRPARIGHDMIVQRPLPGVRQAKAS